jgi:hypothetical protein
MDTSDETSSDRNEAPRRGGWGSPAGWGLTAYFTLGSLFMFSGAIGHSHAPLAHPAAAHVGWILGGLSPLSAYITLILISRRSRSVRWTLFSLLLAVLVLLAVQAVGVLLLRLGLGDQRMLLG